MNYKKDIMMEKVIRDGFSDRIKFLWFERDVLRIFVISHKSGYNDIYRYFCDLFKTNHNDLNNIAKKYNVYDLLLKIKNKG